MTLYATWILVIHTLGGIMWAIFSGILSNLSSTFVLNIKFLKKSINLNLSLICGYSK